jgi:hypothetical protein
MKGEKRVCHTEEFGKSKILDQAAGIGYHLFSAEVRDRNQ